MESKNFRFSHESLVLFLKGCALYNEETLICSYRIEERFGNIWLIIVYDDGQEQLEAEVFLGYDKNTI